MLFWSKVCLASPLEYSSTNMEHQQQKRALGTGQMICKNTWAFLLLLCFSHCFLLSTASEPARSDVKWHLDCGWQDQGNKCSQHISKGCPLDVNFNNLRIGSLRELQLTPVFNGTFFTNSTRRCAKEQRWRPGLNISWTQVPSDKKREYLLKITYVGKKPRDRNKTCDQCLHVTVPATSITKATNPKHQALQTQVISMISNDLHHCKRGSEPQVLHVRVARLVASSGSGQALEDLLESSITFTLNDYGIYGLPMHLNRIVPRVNSSVMDRDFNPRHWVTPLVIRNSSCDGEISVEFELAPPHEDVLNYIIQLYSTSNGDMKLVKREDYKQKENEIFGQVSFQNLTQGTYDIRLEIYTDEETCLTLVAPGQRELRSMDPCYFESSAGCPVVVSGYHQILDCPQELGVSLPDDISVEKLVAIIACSVLGVLILAVLTLWYIAYHRRGLRFMPTSPGLEEDGKVAKKTVFMMYCIDNQSHRDVVLKLADLLQQEGHVTVILEAWTTTISSSMYDWVLTKLQTAHSIILVGSEGASRYLEAHRQGLYWPLLEEATPYHRIYPLAVSAVQQLHSMAPHGNTNKMVLVSFDYAKRDKGMAKQLELLTCNNHHFHLPKDMETLLLHVHNIARFSSGSWVRQWSRDVLNTEAGLKLAEAIKTAEAYHQEHPSWFNEIYGEPISIEESVTKQRNAGCCDENSSNLDAATEVSALWKGPYEIAAEAGITEVPEFTPPEECSEGPENEKDDQYSDACDENKNLEKHRMIEQVNGRRSSDKGSDHIVMDSGIDMTSSFLTDIRSTYQTSEPQIGMRDWNGMYQEEMTTLLKQKPNHGIFHIMGSFHPPSSVDSTESIPMLQDLVDMDVFGQEHYAEGANLQKV